MVNPLKAHTLFGYTKLAHSHTRGTSGIKTGSGGGKPSGRTHLWDTTTGRTACGKQRGDMSTFNVPAEVTEATWIYRISLCKTCRNHVGA